MSVLWLTVISLVQFDFIRTASRAFCNVSNDAPNNRLFMKGGKPLTSFFPLSFTYLLCLRSSRFKCDGLNNRLLAYAFFFLSTVYSFPSSTLVKSCETVKYINRSLLLLPQQIEKPFENE